MSQRIRFLSGSGEFFQRGVIPGAFIGGFVGLIPGILLVLVLGGGQYAVGLLEILSFFAMSLAIGAATGAVVGGITSIFLAFAQQAVRSLRSKS